MVARQSTTLREYALSVVTGTTLTDKLTPPPLRLTDRQPGPALRLEAPGRAVELRIVPAKQAKVPSIDGMPDLVQRKRIVHGSANHELQAVELFAWALLAFPEAPAAFRRGLLQLLGDEQRHCRLYVDRLNDWGMRFGDLPVSGYFWKRIADLKSPIHFICAMCLTFETANLDHSLDYAAAARRAADAKTAAVFERVHADELRHVRFGWRWLAKLKASEQSMWQAYEHALTYPLRPSLGRGPRFSPAARRAAGLSPEFIAQLEQEA